MTHPEATGGPPAPEPRVDGHELGELLAEYRPRLRRMVTLRLDPRLGPRLDASDVVQEAFIEVSRRIEDYRSAAPMPFFLWVRQITAQKMIDLQRRHGEALKRDVHCEVPLPASATTSSITLAHALVRDSSTPSQAAVRVEEAERLRQALEEMKEIDREILLLRHFEGLDFEHCAEILGLTTSGAKMRHLRALDRLGEILRRNCEAFGIDLPGT